MAGVSLAMICRDNAATIGAILDDCKKAGCDELVLIDTGSIDDTPHIAREAGAIVYFDVWQEHFARHKNTAIEHCHNDWILICDSDDRLNTPQAFQHLFTEQLPHLPDSVHAVLMDVAVGPNADFSVGQVRMIRKSSGLRFRYPIHENIDCKSHDVIHPKYLGIIHPHVFNPQHSARNLHILLSNYRADDFNMRGHDEKQHIRLNLGREYSGQARRAQAQEIFREYFSCATPSERNDYWANLYNALSYPAGTSRMTLLRNLSKLNPYRAEAWVEIGRMLMLGKLYRQAVEVLLRADACSTPQDTYYPPDYSWRPPILLAAAYQGLGQDAPSRQWAQVAIARGCPDELLVPG